MVKKISDYKTILNYLEYKYNEWCTTTNKKNRSTIEMHVFQYVDNIDDTLYIEANEGRASGLCSSQFFEEDLKRLINLLSDKIKTNI